MTTELLRIYDPETECEADGYPNTWHKSTVRATVPGGPCETTGCGGAILSPVKDYVRSLAGHRCIRCGHPYSPGIAKEHPRGEWTPCDEHCTHGGPVMVTWATANGGNRALIENLQRSIQDLLGGRADRIEAQWRILTVHHLNGVKYDCRWWNLAALCQRCHLAIQGKVLMERVYPLEHTEWFKPYAAGWYASAYLGQDLTREETMERLDELLALERVA